MSAATNEIHVHPSVYVHHSFYDSVTQCHNQQYCHNIKLIYTVYAHRRSHYWYENAGRSDQK